MCDLVSIELILSGAARLLRIEPIRSRFGFRFHAAEQRTDVDLLSAMWAFHPAHYQTVRYASCSISKEATTQSSYMAVAVLKRAIEEAENPQLTLAPEPIPQGL
jgi:hypothetical protein